MPRAYCSEILREIFYRFSRKLEDHAKVADTAPLYTRFSIIASVRQDGVGTAGHIPVKPQHKRAYGFDMYASGDSTGAPARPRKGDMSPPAEVLFCLPAGLPLLYELLLSVLFHSHLIMWSLQSIAEIFITFLSGKRRWWLPQIVNVFLQFKVVVVRELQRFLEFSGSSSSPVAEDSDSS
ncbi:hypothetical protein C8T65DRAFT_699213 [Cerioporus squamosus]|nr:hypothetical protein C8T65DRAFT_699213 [Cerioporus squamosus]